MNFCYTYITGMPMMSGLAPTSMTASSMAMPIMSNGVPSQIGMMGKYISKLVYVLEYVGLEHAK